MVRSFPLVRTAGWIRHQGCRSTLDSHRGVKCRGRDVGGGVAEGGDVGCDRSWQGGVCDPADGGERLLGQAVRAGPSHDTSGVRDLGGRPPSTQARRLAATCPVHAMLGVVTK